MYFIIEGAKTWKKRSLRNYFNFFREIDKEKFIGRQTYLTDGVRKENDAEHAWHMAIMTVLLAAMNIWMYMVDRKAGGMMSVMVIIYMVIVGVLYVYNRSLILADMVQFSTQLQKQEQRLQTIPLRPLIQTSGW